MIVGLIISIVLAVTFLCLYVCAIQDKASISKDNEWLRKQRSDEHHISPNVSDKKPLDMDGVCEAIRYNGYVPTVKDGDFVEFMIQGISHYVQCNPPIIVLSVSYPVDFAHPDADDPSEDSLRKAAATVEHNVAIGKIQVSDDGVALYAPTLVGSFEEFRDNFPIYLDSLRYLYNKHREEYQALEKAKADNVDNATINNLPQYAQNWEA